MSYIKQTGAALAVGLVMSFAGFASLARADVLAVCERTTEVKAAIEKLLLKTCDAVTDADLATLKRIAIPNKGIAAFKLGDFSGLPSLEILNIKGNPFTTLPEGLLADLPALKTLVIFRTKLAALPEDFLVGNDKLENLHIFSNPFTTIPDAVFGRLEANPNLKVLDFNDALEQAQKDRLQLLFPVGGRAELNFY